MASPCSAIYRSHKTLKNCLKVLKLIIEDETGQKISKSSESRSKITKSIELARSKTFVKAGPEKSLGARTENLFSRCDP